MKESLHISDKLGRNQTNTFGGIIGLNIIFFKFLLRTTITKNARTPDIFTVHNLKAWVGTIRYFSLFTLLDCNFIPHLLLPIIDVAF